MNQDFINWLNSADNADNNGNNNTDTSQDNGLLVAPLSLAYTQDSKEIIQQEAPDSENTHEESQIQSQTQQEETDSESDSKPESESEINNILQELRNLRKQVENLDGNIPAQYDEPPPQTWAEYDTEIDENSELYEHYEQGIDFQEYNDKIPHGTNFTRRLQRILHERKERAAEEKMRADSQKTPHPYMMKGILFCLSLIIAFLFALGVLFFLQKKVPNYTQNTSLIELNEQEQVTQIIEHKPESEPEIIKSGDNTQVKIAKIAEIAKIEQNTQKENPKEIRRPAKPLTFEDYLREGNEAFNLGVYNSALKNFFRALELDDNDTRPYIGLAGAYRAKGLYFDSKRILDEAMMIFRKNPTLETALKILEGESKHGSSKCNRSK